MRKKREKGEKPVGALHLDLDAPTMEFFSNREVILEGNRGVLEYSDALIRVNTAHGMIGFFGRGLTLKCISPEALIVEGFLTRVEFDR